MTERSAFRPARGQSWQRRQAQKRWRGILAVVITAVLILAIFNGIVKSFSLKVHLGDSVWDGRSSLAFVTNTKPLAIFIYQADPGRLVLLKLGASLYFESFDSQAPLGQVADLSEQKDGDQLAQAASRITRSPIKNFMIFEKSENANQATLESFFKSYASPLTPFKIVSATWGDLESTNITRKDMIKLWWQLKSLSVNNLEMVETDDLSEEIVLANGQKVLGVDDASLHELLSKYMENRWLLESNENIKIENASEVIGAGQLAADFIDSVGGRIESVSSVNQKVDECTVYVRNEDSATALYLAKILECAIKSLPDLAKGEIRIVIGVDFAQKYLP